MKKKPILLHPVCLFGGVWLIVLVLYLAHFSKLLLASNQEALSAIGTIVLPFVIALAAVALCYSLSPKRSLGGKYLFSGEDELAELSILKRRLKVWLLFWTIASLGEIIWSGGIPLLWLVTGSSKTYFDFGIPSLHGFLNSLLLALGLTYAGIYAKYGGWRHLLLPLAILAWAVLLVTRNMIIVSLMETALVILLFRGISKSLLLKLVAGVLFVIIGFGALGDLRSGGENFRALAQPTESYPDWLPSGILWFYIYLTTPLNNLTYTMSTVQPVNDPLFPNTAAPLFPSILRGLIYGDSLETTLSGELPDSAFNVSTAYIGPYQDYGRIGMLAFGFFISILAFHFWHRNNFRDQLMYVVIGQCLLISVFYNYFFSLPIITQIIWIYLFFVRGRPVRPLLLPDASQT